MAVNANLATTLLEINRARAGIRNPQVALLSTGTVLFRFASTRNQVTGASIPSSQWARGAWWIEEADYHRILQSYKAGKLALGTVGRSAAAVQPSWSNMDVSIKAVLVDDVFVYTGLGKTQYRDQLPNGMFVTQKGWANIMQVYIPDMRGAAFRAVRVLRQKIITSDSFGF